MKKGNLDLVGYLRSLPVDYLTKSSWISRDSSNSGANTVCINHKSSSEKVHADKHSLSWSSLPVNFALNPSISVPSVEQRKNSSLQSGFKNISVTESSDLQKEKESESDSDGQVILSICWKHEKLGAAFYDASTCQVYVIEDKAESAPEFWILRTLFREIKPKILLCGGKQDERIFKVINELRDDKSVFGSKDKNQAQSSVFLMGHPHLGSADDKESSFIEGSLTTDSSEPSVKLAVRPASEFKYESSIKRILLYPWPGLSKQSSDMEKEALVRTKMDLDAVSAVRALGGLLRFLEVKGTDMLSYSALFRGTPVLGLHSYHMEDLVHVDEATVAFLQIFSEDLHPAAFKSGKSSASKEGLSLFALLSRTASPFASHVLRRMILRPIRNPEVLESRFKFLTWATQPVNFDIVRQIQSCLKNISNIQMLLSKLQRSQVTVKDWKTLYTSLFNMIILSEICSAQDLTIDAFSQLRQSATEELCHITYLIQRTFDFDQSDREGRFVVKPGLDQDLDDKKRQFSSVGDIMHKVAEMELLNLPNEIGSCCVIYLPHVGYLLAISPSVVLDSYLTRSTVCLEDSTSTSVESYNIPGLQFMFRTADMVLFKSALCNELDNEVGDLQVEIANKETSIVLRLSEMILLQSQAFVHFVSKALYIDVLLAFASVSRDFGWIKPTLNTYGNFEVREGRHPLYEVCNPLFVSNDTHFIAKEQTIHILTGPNASGKTAYIKQMSIAIHGATDKSLVLIDEFGSSTYEFDGASLLTSAIDFWTLRKEQSESVPEEAKCPLVLVSTHFYNLYGFLRHPNNVKELRMDTLREGEKIIHLYQVVEGTTKNSYALQVAQACGFPTALIARAKEICELPSPSSLPPRWGPLYSTEEKERCAKIVNDFLNHDINSSLTSLLDKLREHLNSSLDSSLNTSVLTNDEISMNAPSSSLSNRDPGGRKLNLTSGKKLKEYSYAEESQENSNYPLGKCNMKKFRLMSKENPWPVNFVEKNSVVPENHSILNPNANRTISSVLTSIAASANSKEKANSFTDTSSKLTDIFETSIFSLYKS